MDSNQKYEGCSKVVLNLGIFSKKREHQLRLLPGSNVHKKDGNHETVTPFHERYGDHLTSPRYKH
jgi:hypothetical protein